MWKSDIIFIFVVFCMDLMYKIGNKVNDFMYIFVKVGLCIVIMVIDFVFSDKIG